MQNLKIQFLRVCILVLFSGVLFVQSHADVAEKKLQSIGRTALVSLPDFNLKDIKAKVDTGAKTSAIYCSDIVLSHNAKFVEFYLFDKEHSQYSGKKFTLAVERIAKVRSSNGEVENRVFVLINIRYAGKQHTSEFSLSNRISMKYPILLGRSFLRNNYVVDVSKKGK